MSSDEANGFRALKLQYYVRSWPAMFRSYATVDDVDLQDRNNG